MELFNPKISWNDYERGLKEAEAFHGHLCPGMYNGVKMALGAKTLLGYNEFPNKDLIVVTEIDRCLTDAVSVVTGCRLGKRSLKFRDFGKFAATFCSISAGEGIRIAQRKEAFDELHAEMEKRGIGRHDPDAAKVFFELPWERHFSMSSVKTAWREEDLPGSPKIHVACSKCGEMVMDGRHVIIDGKAFCKPCSEG